MKKYILVACFLGVSLVLAGCGNGGGETPAVDRSAEIVLFYGQECPHCKIVEKYIEDNEITEKVTFAQAEVYHNKSNADFLAEKAGKCGFDEKLIGVPFLWEKDKCYVGQEEVIQFFKDKIK
jgi:glutaredoxin-related protein